MPQAGANSRPEKSAQPQTASPVSTLICVRTSMYLRIFAAISSPTSAKSGPFACLLGEGEPLAEIAGLHQGQHQEHEGEDGEADKGIDVPDEGLKEAHEPHHVEPFGQGPDDEDLMLLEPARPFEIDGLEARGMTDQPCALNAQGPGDHGADSDDHGDGQ